MVAVGSESCIFDVQYILGEKLGGQYIVVDNYPEIAQMIKLHYGDIFVCVENEADFVSKAALDGFQHGVEYYLASDLAGILDAVFPIQNNLCASDMFMRVYSAPHKRFRPCSRALYSAEVDKEGNVYACCSAWQKFPMGNVLSEGLYGAWHSFYAKVLRLSALNGTLCFCNSDTCQNAQASSEEYPYRKMNPTPWPYELNVAIDDMCNLCCRFCRTCPPKVTAEKAERRTLIAEALREDLKNISDLYFAGNGEVFLSSTYRELIENVSPNQNLNLVTNGQLYSNELVEALSKKCKSLSVYVSIDAATSTTYQYLRRNGDFFNLLEKLSLMKMQRVTGVISKLVFRFVVQKSNYSEMLEFISLGRKYSADYVDFTRLVDSGSEYTKDFLNRSLLDRDGNLCGEYNDWFKNPAFRNEYVHIDSAFIK